MILIEEINGIPLPTYGKGNAKIISIMEQTYKGLLKELTDGLALNPSNPQTINQVELMRQMSYKLRELDERIYESIEEQITKAFGDGEAYHLLSVKEAKTWDEAIGKATFNTINMGKAKALVDDTYQDILYATANTERYTKMMIRNTVKEVAHYNALLNTNYKTQADELKKKLTKKGLSETIRKDGFVGITDKAGRRWDVGTYSNMVIKTKTNQAFMQGTITQAQESGLDLAVISSHGAKDACSKWEGVVISLTGATKGYPTYKEVVATKEIFHPNCEHKVHPIRTINLLPEEQRELAKTKANALGYTVPEDGLNPLSAKPAVSEVVNTATNPYDARYPLDAVGDTEVKDNLDRFQKQDVYKILEDAPARERALWAKYEKEMKVNNFRKGKGAFYSPSRWNEGVHLNIKEVAKGNHYSEPYQTFFHEFGHNIDYLANRDYGDGTLAKFSTTYKNGLFDATLRADFKAKMQPYIDEVKEHLSDAEWLRENVSLSSNLRSIWQLERGEITKVKYTKAMAYKYMENKFRDIPLLERANASDVLDGITRNRINGGVGHSADYWTSPDKVAGEAFAEMFDSAISAPKQLEVMKDYFPNAYKVFEEMLEVILGVGGE